MSQALAAQVERMGRQQAALVELARAGLAAEEAVRRVVEVAAEILRVARASVWLLSPDRQTLACLALFELPTRLHSAGVVLAATDYPAYFAALDTGRAIDADDARSDPRTREFCEGYLKPLGITAMLDAALRESGEVAGVLCCEHVGAARRWTADEVGFAGALADQVALARSEARRRQLEQDLYQSQKLEALGTLAAGIAHEINNPLAYVRSNLEFVADVVADPDRGSLAQLSEAVSEALGGLERVGGIVKGLGRFSRRGTTSRGAVDVAAAAAAAAKLAGNEIRQRASLVMEIPAVPPVSADETGLVQVLLNLLLNAAQSFRMPDPAGHEIRLSCASGLEYVEIEVSDNGPGVAPDLVGKIFDPFFTSKPVGHGTGLGLSISHSIVKSFGGELRFDSQPGRGTTVRVRLPVALATAVPLAEMQPPIAHQRARFLLVDDESGLVNAVVQYFERTHDVVGVTTGGEALELLSGGEHFDLILCDLMMPGISGMDIYDRLMEVAPESARRMIFMSGGAYTAQAAAFLTRVNNERLAKPFGMRQLRALIEASLVRPV